MVTNLYNIRNLKSACILIAAILFSTTANAQIGLKTDLNGDDKVNISDVSNLIGLIMNRITDDAVTEGLCPDAMHPHSIDLGLPSGAKWTCCNIGAADPFKAGGYYAWAEMYTKYSYTLNNYFYYINNSMVNIPEDIESSTCDQAFILWGEDYQLPTDDFINELYDNTTNERVTINGVKGIIFSADNGNKIFLPAAGLKDGTSIQGSGYGYYWSAIRGTVAPYYASALFFRYDPPQVSSFERHCGLTIRPISWK